MKKLSIGVVLISLLFIGAYVFWGQPLGVIAGQPTMADATPPPTLDPNRELQPVIAPTTPPLPSPLTEREALERAIYFDTISGVEWVEPWSAETIVNNPERIKLSLHNSRAEAARSSGIEAGFSDDLEEDAGQVWVISIRGAANVSAAMSGMGEDELVDGMFYRISARTGVLLGMSTGPFIEQK